VSELITSVYVKYQFQRVFITLDPKRYGDNISLFTHEVTQTTSDVVKTLDYIIQMMTGIRAEEGIFYKLYLLKDIFNAIYLLRKIYLGNILKPKPN